MFSKCFVKFSEVNPIKNDTRNLSYYLCMFQKRHFRLEIILGKSSLSMAMQHFSATAGRKSAAIETQKA